MVNTNSDIIIVNVSIPFKRERGAQEIDTFESCH